MANATSLAGTWAYRSYLNQADQRPFGGGLFAFQTPTPATLTGTLDMGSDLVLDLQGTITLATGDGPLTAEIKGVGRPGSKTDGERPTRALAVPAQGRSPAAPPSRRRS